MKTIIKSILFVAVLALAITGCQKETDDLSVSLKSSTPFTGGNCKSNWFPGGGASAECALAGGCDAGSYKMDHGVASGIIYSEDGITVTGITDKSFSWTSTKPVCKIIVKAGTGAYIFEIGGLKSGIMEYPVITGVKAKGISHITFCYSEPLIIAVKIYYWNRDRYVYGVSRGTQVFVGSEWCATYPLGINDYPSTASFDMFAPGSNAVIGEVAVENGDVTITLNAGLTLVYTYLYVGTLEDLQTSNLNTDGCPWYTNTAVWMRNATPDTDGNGLSFMFFDL